MTHLYQIEGMSCQSCIAKVKSELLKLGEITEAEVQLVFPQARLTMSSHVSLSTLQNAIAKAGDYKITGIGDIPVSAAGADQGKNWLKIYKPLLLVFAFISMVATLVSFRDGEFHAMHWMHNFMGGFFIAFSFFKFLDLKGFADSYSSYDLLAKNVYSYGLIYPFIELGLGLAYISYREPLVTSVVTVVVMGFSSMGVIQAVMNKRKIRCACLGAVFNLPMSTVTIVEDLLMVVMGIVMIVALV
ncbi:MAG TPA: MauE/DoxX family redox-associated membrane protein [Chitinophagaceae bacterium]|nr:MauE/DoxX family redox-associated membrane protein [Chitinophagaceae bacterium]